MKTSLNRVPLSRLRERVGVRAVPHAQKSAFAQALTLTLSHLVGEGNAKSGA
jgi:hypothetical protein